METLDIAALRADTPGCARVVHLNNAGSSLPPTPVLDAMVGHLAVVTHVPASSGLIAPVAEIGRHYRELDLLYLVDACQSIGQLPLDVTEIGADLLAATGRKFLRGPRGTGLLFVSERVLAAGYEPLFIDMRGAHWTEPGAYRPVASAARFEDWEFPYAGLLGLAAAIRYARRVGVPALSRRALALAASLRERLRAIDGVRVLDRGPALGAIVTCTIAGAAAEPLKARLAAHGVNSSVTLREHARFDFAGKGVDWCLRLSPHYFNTDDEIARAAGVLESR